MRKKVYLATKYIFLILLIVLSLQYVLPAMNTPEFKEFVVSIGLWGPLVIILYLVASHILAPLSGSPALILSYSLYGAFLGTLYSYLAHMISAALCFVIARHFGREWVEHLAGKKGMKEIDEFVEMSGDKILILGRLFGFPLYEFISYAAGFTKIAFKRYMAITIIFGAIPFTFFGLLYQKVDFTSEKGILLWFGILVTVGFVFGVSFNKAFKKLHKSKVK